MLGPPKGIIIHHSLTKDGKTESWASIKKYHMEEKGWDNIGYHLGLEYVGDKVMIIEGRPMNMQGGHCVGKNTWLGICVVGNFDQEKCPSDKFESLVELVRALVGQYKFTKEQIQPHNKYAPKSCPGKLFQFQELITRVFT